MGIKLAGATLADLPSIALTDVNPQKVALVVYGTTVGTSISLTPCSVSTHIVADRNYPIDSTDKVAGMPGPEFVFCIRFFNGLPTVNAPFFSDTQTPSSA